MVQDTDGFVLIRVKKKIKKKNKKKKIKKKKNRGQIIIETKMGK